MAQLRSNHFARVRSGCVRRWALGAFVGGWVFLAAAVSQWVSPSASSTDLLLAAALLITAAGPVGIHIRYSHSYGTLGVLGVLATGLGQLIQAAAAVGSAVTGDPASGWPTWLFLIGSLLFLSGLLILTTAIFRSGVTPRWLGLVLIGGVLVSGAAQSIAGPAPFGAAWIVVSYLMVGQDTGARTETESSDIDLERPG
jgi:hypothetical protein